MKSVGIIKEDIRCIVLSTKYVELLKNLGFSKEFILNEQIRRQKECIEYLLNEIADPRNGFDISNN